MKEDHLPNIQKINWDGIVIGNTVSIVYFNTHHQAQIANGRLHTIVDTCEYPYIELLMPDTSKILILKDEIRTIRKK